jgi:Sds3-like
VVRVFQERNDLIKSQSEAVNNNTHPEIKKLFLELEASRTERVRRAKVSRKYRLAEISRKYDVEAEIVKRQFAADRALVREKLIEELTAQWFQIHREKRALDMCVPGTYQHPASPPFGLFVCRLTVGDFAWRVPEKRSVQVKHRKAQNYEIMVLEETKKYFGMPAAPKISRISDDEINRDLALMKVPPPKPVIPNFCFLLGMELTSSNDRIRVTK